jgi:hypothetical protein
VTLSKPKTMFTVKSLNYFDLAELRLVIFHSPLE